jgi:DNA-binding transcriptional LysR family regulator
MINLNQLRIFYHVAKRLNFTAAASDLFITQPAVSAQMKSFEDYCGVRLFRRRGKVLYLTDEGAILYEHARRIFECEKEIENTLEEMKSLKQGVLRLGTTKTYARYFMPEIITRFHDAYPSIKVQLNEGSSREMTESLLDFQNDVALIAKTVDHQDVVFKPFSQEEVVLIAAPGKTWGRGGSPRLSDIALEPIIMKEKGSGTRKLVSELFAGAGIEPNILMETGNTEFIKQVVQRGEGVSFLVKAAVALEGQEGKLQLLTIQDHPLRLDVSIAHLKGQFLSPPARVFLDMLSKISAATGDPAKGLRAIMAEVLLSHWNVPSRGGDGQPPRQRKGH